MDQRENSAAYLNQNKGIENKIMRTLEETVTIVNKNASELLMCILISHIWKVFNKKPIRVHIVTNAMVNEFFVSVIVFLILRPIYVSGIVNGYFGSRKLLKLAYQVYAHLIVLGFVGQFAMSILVRQCYQLNLFHSHCDNFIPFQNFSWKQVTVKSWFHRSFSIKW